MVEDTLDESKFVLYDAAAMTTVLHPECILESTLQYCTVELHGEFTKGMMVVDWRSHMGKKANVNIILKLDSNVIMKALDKSMRTENEVHQNGDVKDCIDMKITNGPIGGLVTA